MTDTGKGNHFYEPTREKRYGRDLSIIQTLQQEAKPIGVTEPHQPFISSDTGQAMAGRCQKDNATHSRSRAGDGTSENPGSD